jgi:hypothetical protein
MIRNKKCRTLMCKIRMRRKVDNQNTITQSGEYQNIRHLSTEVSHG